MTDDDLTPATPPPPTGKREAKADLRAAKARDKAMRPWYKKKRFILPLALVAMVVLGVAASGGEGDGDEPIAAGGETEDAAESTAESEAAAETPAEPEAGGPGSLYPDRPDQQDEDKEAAVGESVMLRGYTATLTGASYGVQEFTDTGIVTIEVKLENRDDGAQAYNTFDWRIQTANGQVLDPSFMGENTLGSGDLVGGGVVEGTVGFEVGPGTYYVIYKPDAFASDRGVWQITVGG